MSAEDRSIADGSRSTKFFRPSQLRRLRGCEQVAAVCYRINGQGIEFLLVQTRRGRWTFPKGGVEPRLTHAQTAALEAFEEAGVHGRIEEEAFARYVRRKQGNMRRSPGVEIAVHAHLCEVLWLSPPQEPGRNPTWLSPEKAKRRLQESRRPCDAAEFARVVDRAVARIQRLRNPPCAARDALRKVRFEAFPETGIYTRIEEAFFGRYIRKRGDLRQAAGIEAALDPQPKLLQLGPAQNGNRRLLEARTPDYRAQPVRVAEPKVRGTGKKNRRNVTNE
jgi:8-oxo-dGTP pyrophosphatase MutT (NUDIX family)